MTTEISIININKQLINYPVDYAASLLIEKDQQLHFVVRTQIARSTSFVINI